MSIFSAKKLSYLGIDLGNASVKVVELKNEGGRPCLVTYGYAELPLFQAGTRTQVSEDEMAVLINKICSQAKTTTNRAVAALPNFSVFSSIISLPQMSKKELDQAVVWEAKKFIPLPLEEMNLYWEIIENTKNTRPIFSRQGEKNLGGQAESTGVVELTKEQGRHKAEERANLAYGKASSNLKILVTAAPKKKVNRYLTIFQKAKLELLNLETESFALERSLVGLENAPVMIVDIGAVSSDLTIVDGGIPVLNRSVDTGGFSITQQIAQNINVDLKRAEQFKRDFGFKQSELNGIPKVIESSIEPVVNEIRYCFDLYSSQEKDNKKVEKIILTGGSAYLPNLTGYLNKLLNIKVIIGDPWARVIYPVELKPVLDELGPRFSVAVGLAMREIE